MPVKCGEAGTQLIINTYMRRLSYCRGDKTPSDYPVAVGKPSTPTPNGNYQVINKTINPGGMLGTRWIGLSIPNGPYGIHGTNNPSSIGQAVSHGCIRMHNSDIEMIFPEVSVGTPVIIVSGQDNAESDAPAQGHSGVRTYTVQSGDTLWQISIRFGISLEDIIKANPNINPAQIYPGQQINIP